MRKDDHYRLIGLYLLLVCALVLFLLTGCRTKYVPVPEYHTEFVDHYIYDSVFIESFKADSTVVHEGGDTVLVEKWHWAWRDRWHDVIKIDTFIQRDSVYVPYPVEGKVSLSRKLELVGVGAAAGGILTGAVFLAARIRGRLRKRVLS